jgi:hypothetical protein
MTDMKSSILIILIFPFLTLGQNKFVGEYRHLLHLTDTLEKPAPDYVYNRHFTINSDHSFIYYEEENPEIFTPSIRETFQGSWKSKGDTITFYNKDFKEPKGIKFNYIENQNFKGIKVIVKDFKEKNLNVDHCLVDSVNPITKRGQMYVTYKHFNLNTISIQDPCYTFLYFRPHGHCADFRVCDIGINLSALKSGTLVEVICYSQDMNIKFRSKQFILSGNILHEVSTSCIMPDSFTDNFIKEK